MNFNDARIFVKDIDENTLNQFRMCVKLPFVTDAALMPDAHFGYVAPIGSVLVTRGVIVPSWVGYDIGCGVSAIRIKAPNLLFKIKKNSEKIFKNTKNFVPMGLGKLNAEHKVSRENKEKFKELLNKLEKKGINSEIFSFIKRKGISNLGTIGHGNHFAEIDYYKKEVWIVVHSGSRNIGHKVATHYMKEAALLSNSENSASSGRGETRHEVTCELKASSKLGKEYQAVLDFLLEFALLNRIEIAKEITQSIEDVLGEEIKMELWTNKNHNHAVKFGRGKWVHRKGATPSKRNERGVIPANMRDGSFLVTGKGNKKFIESSSHGAGRRMSKTSAKKTVKIKEFEKSMQGITASVNEKTIDESPFAYKNITTVLSEQKESIKVIKQLKPIINFKGY